MIILSVLGVILFSLILIRSTDLLTDHLKILSKKTKLGDFFLTSFIVGLATSLPELSVGITSALEGIPNIAVGNAIGSNIANLSIITGVATLIAGTLVLRGRSYTTDFLYALFAGLAPILLLIDGKLTRVDGLILLSLYGYYNYALLKEHVKPEKEKYGFFSTLIYQLRRKHIGRNLRYVFLALTLIILSADMIVRNGQFIAGSLGVPVFMIGLFLLAIGTSLPELAFGVRSIKRREPKLFMGNLLGSTVANATLVIGITAVIHPVVPVSISKYLVAAAVFVAVVLVFLLFLKTKKKLVRWEGAILIALYLLFFLLEAYQHYMG